jgi:hypothetical protein
MMKKFDDTARASDLTLIAEAEVTTRRADLRHALDSVAVTKATLSVDDAFATSISL